MKSTVCVAKYMKNTISNVSVDILVNGKPIKQHSHDDKIFVEAKEGSTFEIKVQNNSYSDIECIVGIDGIDVITGQPFNDKSTGYIISKFHPLKLDGYRLSDDKVAAFKFCKTGESYADSKTVNAQNGIITIKCYNKRVDFVVSYNNTPPWQLIPDLTPEPFYSSNTPHFSGTLKGSISHDNIVRSCNTASYSAEIKPSEHFDAGTTFGEAKESKVTHVSFERGNLLGEMNIFYAFRKGLEEIGIKFTSEKKIVYPVGTSAYCTPPPGWKG